jgi:hypothetical protein
MRFHIRHPQDAEGRAAYGYDGPSGLGFFVHATLRGVAVRYDGRAPSYDHDRPLDAALRWMAAQGFYTVDDLEEAIVRLQHDLIEEMPRRYGRIARVVWNFKRAAD